MKAHEFFYQCRLHLRSYHGCVGIFSMLITAKKTYDVIMTSRAQIFAKFSEKITFTYGMTLRKLEIILIIQIEIITNRFPS